MGDDKIGNLFRLPIDSIDESVEVKPKVANTDEEVNQVLLDLYLAVDNKAYIPQTPTESNPALSDDYIFDTNDENLVLKDLKMENFVGKMKDLSKGSKKRKELRYPEEYLYVFKYPCKLWRRDAQESRINTENVLIYIKINDRKIPNQKIFVISFHKNKVTNR